MEKIIEILNHQDLEDAMETSANKPILLFKHSTSCSNSARALKQYQEFLENSDEEKIGSYLVKVQKTRVVSNQIEADTGVKHESPQIFLFKDKKVLWHTSHSKIKVHAIEEVLNNL
ncbi:bacillithiol system redox-active protein YtxJ [Paucisalibacillus globulus]|uniref:bacillithiol system redox-active protein YtxJ n=1 Tax=Paucisalibacillus globulus TaxID=351095 RepID=UPI0003F837FB|nr:bacillithiol system redox-active protein YtxJ [Paucisalibacillus globulus]